MSVPDEARWAERWSRRGTLRAALATCATAAFADGCSSDAPGSTTDTAAGNAAPHGRAPRAASALPAPGRLTDPAQPRLHPEASGLPSARAVVNGVALTFHGDGPPSIANALLAEAERAGARVTVLAVGRWLGEHPETARRVLDGGHELGNHTENHLDIDAMSAQGAYAEIEKCAARLSSLTGSQGRWFRPSQAPHATATVRAAARRAGYQTVLSYDLDSRDYADPGADAVVHNVLSAVRAGDVVSMHLGHRGTVEALPAILDGLHARGLHAVTASALFPQPLHAPEVARR